MKTTTTTTRTGADLLYDLAKVLGDEASYLEGLRKVNERKAEILEALSPGFHAGEERTFVVSPGYDPKYVEVGMTDEPEFRMHARFLPIDPAYDFKLPSDLAPPMQEAEAAEEPLAIASTY